MTIEPYGLDISWRIAALAKHRLPQWRDRIFVGNAIDWEPPHRFDIVQAGLDEVPAARRRELLDRILSTMVVPGVWVESSGGGSKWASWQAMPGKPSDRPPSEA